MDRAALFALFGAGEGIRTTIGVAVAGIETPVYEPRIAAARQALGETAFVATWAAGRGLSVGEAVSFGREVALRAEDPSPATPPQIHGAKDVPAPEAIERLLVPVATSSQPGLLVRAMGTLEISLDGRTLRDGDWSHLRPRELLLHLLCHRGGRTRQQVGKAMWPGSSPAQVKNSFHVALHHLRKRVEAAVREAREHPERGLGALREARSAPSTATTTSSWWLGTASDRDGHGLRAPR